MAGEFLFDIEANDLLPNVTQLWVVVMYDLQSEKRQTWRFDETGWQEVFKDADVLAGHNISGYDIPVIEKLYGIKPKKTCKIRDTLILSRVLDYARFPGCVHSLEAWGEYFGFPKIQFDDFSKFSEEMVIYCERDVDLNVLVYKEVMREFKALLPKAPRLPIYIKAEQAVAKWAALAEMRGWPFNVEKAQALYKQLLDEVNAIEAKLSVRLGTKTVAIDKKASEEYAEVKVPKWTKAGCYDVHTANYFSVDPWSGYEGEERIVEGPYCRVKFEPLQLSSVADVKTFLYRQGWVPTEWNFKKEPGSFKKIKTSPKITEDSLELLGGDGALYADYVSSSSRLSILKTWLQSVDANGRLHGKCITIGTPSMRATHSIIVNIPSAEARWGPEMRALFEAPPNWSLIGCDSASNQARGLAHYLNNDQFTDALINGDIHTFNAQLIDASLKKMGIDWDDYLIKSGVKADESHTLAQNLAKRKRASAKRILYAFLFGASGGKLWSYIFSVADDALGREFKQHFEKAIPNFKTLLTRLETIYGATKKQGKGYIPGIAGNRIYVDSFHKLLVYLLQSTEKATCAAAVMLTMERLEEENIPYEPYIMMHDEEDFAVPSEFRERAAQIGKQAFIDGPKLMGINIMDGDAKVGLNWLEVH